MACCFHSGREGWKVIAPALRTPRGTVTTTASALNVLIQPDSVEVAITSAPNRTETYVIIITIIIIIIIITIIIIIINIHVHVHYSLTVS